MVLVALLVGLKCCFACRYVYVSHDSWLDGMELARVWLVWVEWVLQCVRRIWCIRLGWLWAVYVNIASMDHDFFLALLGLERSGIMGEKCG